MSDPVTTPAAKAASAIGAGVGSSALSMATASGSFLPTDLAGWMALLASFAALVYTVHLLLAFWWRTFWRDFAVNRGWVKKHKTAFRVDEEGNVTREDV